MTGPTSTARPALHFTPRRGWINDPVGLTWHGGRYHLFFQHVPDRTRWAPEQSWGHATSTDLLGWQEHQVAVAPGDGDDGVWSGSVVAPETGPAAIFYTGVAAPDLSQGRIRTARPVDGTWARWRRTDLVVEPPADLALTAFRDPHVLHDGASWLMVVGAGRADGTACALAYRSDDLEQWRYDGVLLGRHTTDRTPVWTGSVWECPQLIPVGDRWVLTVSVWESGQSHYEAYAVGDLVDGRFRPQRWARLTYGSSYYAGSSFSDAEGRQGLIHWLRNVRDPAGRWAGAHSLPHRIAVDGDRLVARPHPQLDGTRTGREVITAARTVELAAAADLEWTFDPARTSTLTLAGPAGPDVTVVCADEHLVAATAAATERMPCRGTTIRVVLDGPTLEVFAADGVLALVVPTAAGGRTARVDRGELVHHALIRGRGRDDDRSG